MAETSPQDVKSTERLHHYWVHGEGAAKIRWGEPDDFRRCVEHLGKFIRDPRGYCNLAHKAATGMWPAQHAELEKHGRRAAMADTQPTHDADGLDESWDQAGDDIPDLTGLGVSHFEAAEKALGMIPPAGNAPGNASRAAAPGSGARFKALKGKLAAKGAADPGALAAWIGRRKFGHKAFQAMAAHARKSGSSRAESLAPYTRTAPLKDVSVRTTRDGKVVRAYMAVFNTPAEVHDQDGDYNEELDPVVFNRAISDARPQGGRHAWRTGVFYNHGMTIWGTPSEQFSVPLGVPLDLQTDSDGVITETQYHRSEFADSIVEGLESGAIPGYSFSGKFLRSNPLIPRGGFRHDRYGNLPSVRRLESTLREYGPTPFPVYKDAAVVGMRAEMLSAMAADPELALRMLGMLRDGAPQDSPPASSAPQEGDSLPGDSHLLVRSSRSVKEEVLAARSAFLQRQYRS